MQTVNNENHGWFSFYYGLMKVIVVIVTEIYQTKLHVWTMYVKNKGERDFGEVPSH